MLKSILTVFLFCLIQTPAHAVSKTKAVEIFQKVVHSAERMYGPMPLAALYWDTSSFYPNAYITADECWDPVAQICIVVVANWLPSLTEGQLAAIIGHEISHYFNGDFMGVSWDEQESERQADRMGIDIAKSAGYDACSMREVWKGFAGEDRSMTGGGTHPTSWSRYVAISKHCGLPI